MFALSTIRATNRAANIAGLRRFLPLLAVFAISTMLPAQTAPDSGTADPVSGHERILLVLPFENSNAQSDSPAASPTQTQTQTQTQADAQANVDWLREAAPDILNARFTSAGFFPLTRDDRDYALDHLGLPEAFQPSRATALRIAQTLDADYILIGSYSTNGTTLTLKARVLDVGKLRLEPEIVKTGQIAQLIPLLDSLAWRLTRQLDPSFGVAEETFLAAGSRLRLDAFEQYIRGITEHDPAERLRHLKKATDLNPNFTEAWLATGKLQFAEQEYEQASVSFAKVTHSVKATDASNTDPEELEAAYYRGLSLIFSGNYPRAEEAFAAVARVLPLPEAVNNEAVAISRRGHDAVALFRQAAAADPTDPDYHFNLAVSLHRHGDKAEALTEIAQSLKLRSNDSEAQAAQAAWRSSPETASARPANADPSDPIAQVEPLERIKRTYDGAAFRQAALMLDQVDSMRLAALPGPARAAQLNTSAHEKLDRGLLLEAERGYQAALAADDHSPQAHAGLAEVRERAGDPEAARKEAQATLALPTDRLSDLEALLVLARLDLAQNRLTEARAEATQASLLDATSRAAKDLRKTIDTRMEAKPISESTPAAKPDTPAKP